MKRKLLLGVLSICVILVSTVLVFASVPAPPVNQTIGINDSVFDDLAEADCRACHEDPNVVQDQSIPDRHHLLYGSTIPTGNCSTFNGSCSVTTTDICQNDTDCPIGETCVQGAQRPCVSDADCTAPRNLCNLRGQDCPVGTCSVTTTTSCTIDADCPTGETCDVAGCPQSYTGQFCGQPICQGGSAVQDSDSDDNGTTDTTYACLNCHVEDSSGGIVEFLVIRDCLQCHQQALDTPTVHHATATAKNGDCVACHGTLVDNPTGCKQNTCSVTTTTVCTVDADCPVGETCVAGTIPGTCDDSHAIPTYSPSLVTPEPSHHAHECAVALTTCEINDDCAVGACSVTSTTACHEDTDCPTGETCVGGDFCQEVVPETELAGGCAYCHNPGTDTGSGVLVVGNHDTHHGSGVAKNELGGSDSTKCIWCHKAGNPHNAGGEDADRIRWCENCHGYESLHNIALDSDTGCQLGDPGCDVVIGGELAGYSHVGNNDDCWGCHGFVQSAAPGSGPATPFLASSDVFDMTTGDDTAVTLNGSALTNVVGSYLWESEVLMTDADGVSTTLAPEIVTSNQLAVTVPGTTEPGTYSLRAVKGTYAASNPVMISVTPQVAIVDVACDRKTGVLAISGTGFGEKPAGTDAYINVDVDGQLVEIISWSDTEIQATVSRCAPNATVTVNALYGSATNGGNGNGNGNGKGKK